MPLWNSLPLHRQGSTPLMRASTVEIARMLLDAGADVNAKDIEVYRIPCFTSLCVDISLPLEESI